MFSSVQSWTLIGFTAIVWLALMYLGVIKGGDPGAIVDLPKAFPMILAAMAVYERWGWRLPFLHPLVVGQPVILGTWRGELTSLWEDKDHERPAPKVVYLAIRQTLTTVQVRLLTDESASDQLAGSVAKLPNGDWVVSYTYNNTPMIDRRADSPPHLGGALLTIYGGPLPRLEGEYWTGRRTMGKLSMTGHVGKIAQGFPEAEALFRDVPAQE